MVMAIHTHGVPFNGYNPEEMAKCPYPAIPAYLGKEPKDTLQIPNAQVTHIWTDEPADAIHVAKLLRFQMLWKKRLML